MTNLKVENVVRMPQRREMRRERISPSLLVSLLIGVASFSIGVVLSSFSPTYGAAAAGAIVMAIIILLRLDELTAMLLIAIHIWLDSYLGLHLVAMFMAVVLLSLYYLGRSSRHPWTGPRLPGLWVVFLILTIYPTMNGAAFRAYDAYSFYLHLVISTFLMFWLGNIIAKDISAVRRVFQLLSVLATLIAIHTIIEAVTGKFFFASAHIEAGLVQYAHFQIVGTGVSRAGSFFGNPDGNAAFLATCLFLPLGLCIESRRFWARIFYLLEILLILQALLFTYSTGGEIGALAGILALVFLTGCIRRSLLLLLSTAIMIGTLLAVFPAQIAAQLFHASEGSAFLLHMGSWQTAIRVIEAFPLFGIGLGPQAYLVAADPYRVAAQYVPLAEPDNSYLQWGAMGGIPVMLVFLLLIAGAIWFAWRNWLAIDTRYRPLLGGGIAALISLSITSLSVDGWTSPSDIAYLGWLIAGIVASPLLVRCQRQQSSPPAADMPLPIAAYPLSLPVADNLSIAAQPGQPPPALPQKADTSMLKKEHPSQDAMLEEEQSNGDTQSYLSLALSMIKSSGIYALGALASPLVSLVLAPFLTHHLSSANYGGLAVLYTIIDLVTVITQLGLVAAFFRAYNGDYELPRDRLEVLAASVILLVLVSLPLAIVLMIAAPWLSEILFNTPSFAGPVRLAVLVIILENLTVPGVSWLRAEKRAFLFSALSIANVLLVLGTNIVLVGMLHMDMSGALIAKGAGYAVIVIMTLPVILFMLVRQRSLHLRTDIVRSMLLFGVPTIFSDMAGWVLQLSDRYLLSHFGSLAQTASYTVAYTLGAVLAPVILAPFGLAWTPIMYSIAKREDAAHVFQLVFRWFNTILLFATFSLLLLSTFFLEILFPPAYRSAELIIPFIALSTMLIGVYYVFMTGVYIRRRTILEFVFMAVAASVNVLLNIALIPYFGAIGAAVSTLLAYIVLASVSYVVNQRIYPVGFEIGPFVMKLLVGILLYVGSASLAHTQQPLLRWSISICALMLYGIFLLLLGGLSVKKCIKIACSLWKALDKGGNKTYA